jgi:HEAT repeat protein
MPSDPTDPLFDAPSRVGAMECLRQLLRSEAATAVHARLAGGFTSPLTGVRRRAVELSAELPDASPFHPAWLQLLDDPEWMVREAVVNALAVQAGRPDIASRLLAITLADPKPHVREAAAKAVGPHVNPAVDFGPSLRHRFERQRERAAVALGFAVTRWEDAVRLLLTAVTDGHRKVRAAVVTALGRLPKTDAARVALTAKAAENEPRVRDAARRALAESNAP